MKARINIFPALLLIMLFITGETFAQNAKPDEKEQEETEMQQNKDAILKLVDGRSFVLKAQELQDRNLNTYNVNTTTNFVKIDGDRAVIQFGFENVVGWNGVGGLTVDGKLSNFRVSGRDGLEPTFIAADVTSAATGSLSLYITVFNDGAARATVTGSFGSRLTFLGGFEALDGSNIYQGRKSY